LVGEAGKAVRRGDQRGVSVHRRAMEEVLNMEEAQALRRTETVDDRFDVARFNSGDVERKRSTFFIGRVG